VALSATVLFGAMGLAVDAGRLYLARNEAQSYADAAALAAALELDGTPAGMEAARAAARSTGNRWDFGSRPFPAPRVMFSADPREGWKEAPGQAAGILYARVEVRAIVPTLFMPVFTHTPEAPVSAAAVAGQSPETTFREGLAPFSPMGRVRDGPSFGFVPGELYSLMWPEGGLSSECRGDAGATPLEQAGRRRGADGGTGFFGSTEPASVRGEIESGSQAGPVAVGGHLPLAAQGPARGEVLDALMARIRQDGDQWSLTYQSYAAHPAQNGRRLVVVPIGDPDRGKAVLGFGAFLLLPASYYSARADTALCAEFVGPYVRGAARQGAATGGGAYRVRLIR
jgi:hypothetical protein